MEEAHSRQKEIQELRQAELESWLLMCWGLECSGEKRGSTLSIYVIGKLWVLHEFTAFFLGKS